jgi:predicted transcriptional regulator
VNKVTLDRTTFEQLLRDGLIEEFDKNDKGVQYRLTERGYAVVQREQALKAKGAQPSGFV